MIALPQMRGMLASAVTTPPPTDPLFAFVRLLCHFNTDSPWTDEIGHTSTVVGAPTLNAGGQFGNAIDFDGTTDSIYFTPTSTEFDFANTDDYTIEFTLRPTRLGSFAEGFVDMAAGSLGVNAPFIYFNGAGNVCAFWAGVDQTFSPGPPLINSWASNAIAFENSSGTKRLYINGVVQGTPTTTTLNITSGPIRLGRASSGAFPYRGRMDELRITAAARYGGVNYTPAVAPFPDM